MAYNFEEFLDSIQKDERIGLSDVMYIMSLSRQSLEENNKKKEYPILNFYCNWCVHSKLTGSVSAFETLKTLTDALLDKSEKQDEIRRISDAFSLDELRSQIFNFHKYLNIKTFLFDDFRNWKNFRKLLLKDLEHKPIEIKKNCEPKKENTPQFKILKAMKQKAQNRPLGYVNKTWISYLPRNNAMYVKMNCFFWNINTSAGISVNGPIIFSENVK